MEAYDGTIVSEGIVEGKIMCFHARKDDFATEQIQDTEDELVKLRDGICSTEEILKKREDVFKSENREQEVILAQAHRLLLSDIIEQGECESLIANDKYSARRAVHEAGTKIRMQFESLPDDFMRERVADVKYVVELLLQILGGDSCSFPKIQEPVILVADELIPQATLCFEQQHIKAMIIKNGTYHSHPSILARLWHIPAMVGITCKDEWNGRHAVVDADHGILYLDPTEEILKLAEERKKQDEWWF